jgi:hypothetical protein
VSNPQGTSVPRELIVLTWRRSGKPAATFTDVDAMRAWLRLGGWAAGHMFHRETVPLNPVTR